MHRLKHSWPGLLPNTRSRETNARRYKKKKRLNKKRKRLSWSAMKTLYASYKNKQKRRKRSWRWWKSKKLKRRWQTNFLNFNNKVNHHHLFLLHLDKQEVPSILLNILLSLLMLLNPRLSPLMLPRWFSHRLIKPQHHHLPQIPSLHKGVTKIHSLTSIALI